MTEFNGIMLIFVYFTAEFELIFWIDLCHVPFLSLPVLCPCHDCVSAAKLVLLHLLTFPANESHYKILGWNKLWNVNVLFIWNMHVTTE